MWQDFGDYILSQAGDKPVKIAEIGVGKFDQISNLLSEKENVTIIKTDIIPKDESVIKDDVTNWYYGNQLNLLVGQTSKWASAPHNKSCTKNQCTANHKATYKWRFEYWQSKNEIKES